MRGRVYGNYTSLFNNWCVYATATSWKPINSITVYIWGLRGCDNGESEKWITHTHSHKRMCMHTHTQAYLLFAVMMCHMACSFTMERRGVRVKRTVLPRLFIVLLLPPCKKKKKKHKGPQSPFPSCFSVSHRPPPAGKNRPAVGKSSPPLWRQAPWIAGRGHRYPPN